jgi:hypothetical protein
MIIQLVNIGEKAYVLGCHFGYLFAVIYNVKRVATIRKDIPLKLETIRRPPSRSGGALHT